MRTKNLMADYEQLAKKDRHIVLLLLSVNANNGTMKLSFKISM